MTEHSSEERSRRGAGAGITIALCIDGGYAPWAATTMASSLRSNPGEDVNFHVVHDSSLSSVDIDGLTKVVDDGNSRIAFHAVQRASLDFLPRTAGFGSIVWLRFYLQEILSEVPKVLYLDADTFVTGSLTELWSTPLGEAPLAAVANVVEPSMRDHVAALGLDYPGGFFNSGVLLLNLESLRAERSLNRVIRFAEEHGRELIWPDQDALNVVFAHRWLSLHPRFNAQNSLWGWRAWAVEVFGEEAVNDATGAPVIRHFEGPGLCKPWHYMCPVPGYQEYRKVLAATPWADTPIVDRTAATRLIRLLPADRQLGAYRRLERWRDARRGR